jgi:hypothetical protein
VTDRPLSLREDTRGLTSAEWLVIGLVLLGAATLAFDRLSTSVSSEGEVVARAIETGEGAVRTPSVGASAPSVGASAPSPPGPSTWDQIRFGAAAVASGFNLYSYRLLANLVDGNPRPMLDFMGGAFAGGLINEPNLDQAAGDFVVSTAVGITPIGLVPDTRDYFAAVYYYTEGSGSASDVGLALIAFIPAFGDGARGTARMSRAIRIMNGPIVNGGVIAVGVADGMTDVTTGVVNEPSGIR